jgi:hypothetical protein
MIKCELCEPKEVKAECCISWGNNIKQKANLCDKHIFETWEKVKPFIDTGKAFWTQEQITDEVHSGEIL